jgi:hypothetical protein
MAPAVAMDSVSSKAPDAQKTLMMLTNGEFSADTNKIIDSKDSRDLLEKLIYQPDEYSYKSSYSPYTEKHLYSLLNSDSNSKEPVETNQAELSIEIINKKTINNNSNLIERTNIIVDSTSDMQNLNYVKSNYIYEKTYEKTENNPFSKNNLITNLNSDIIYLHKSAQEDFLSSNKDIKHNGFNIISLNTNPYPANISANKSLRSLKEIEKPISVPSIRDPYAVSGDSVSNLYQLFANSHESNLGEINAQQSTSANLNLLNLNQLLPYKNGHLNDSNKLLIGNNFLLKNGKVNIGNKQIYKNYALIVGINDYNDRRRLSTSVNDADKIAKIFGDMGYEIIKLTDNTERQPTKKNILDIALAEIKQKTNRGNTIFYFSGHGERDKAGNVYLIPKDGSSDLSTCISQSELKIRFQDINNLAMVIDSCYSGGLADCISEGQIILTSSQENEPSNEQWFDSLSVFTYNFCKAVNDAKESGRGILLQECFVEARDDTTLWSRSRLLSQDPEIIDKTDGNFVI